MTPNADYVPGVTLHEGVAILRVWAPYADKVDWLLETAPGQFVRVTLAEEADGVWLGKHEARPGQRYWVELTGPGGTQRRADPASRCQPLGTTGPSEIVDVRRLGERKVSFRWKPLSELVIYEIHVGTMTGEGTFRAVIKHLPRLAQLGVTAIQLMPIAAFPGRRGWGYDGVFPFAPTPAYGTPTDLADLVAAAHGEGIAVLLDVVHNHVGPEDNYLADFGPYFTSRYETPWGRALNFHDRGSGHVRTFFIQSALHWLETYDIDGLRLDAIQAIEDPSAYSFLHELVDNVNALERSRGRPALLIAETDRNDPSLVRPRHHGGVGLDAVYNDELHHALVARISGERAGYYADLGSTAQVRKGLRDGFVHDGEHVPFRGRRHGRTSRAIAPERLLIFSENHDQCGNHPTGARLTRLLDQTDYALAVATTLLHASTPLLFMGEELGCEQPFYFFHDFANAGLAAAVRRGRRREAREFGWSTPYKVPDPASERAFLASKVDWTALGLDNASAPHPHGRDELHRSLLTIRAQYPSLRTGHRTMLPSSSDMVAWRCVDGRESVVVALCLSHEPTMLELPFSRARWRLELSTVPSEAALAGEAPEHPRQDRAQPDGPWQQVWVPGRSANVFVAIDPTSEGV